MSKNKQARVGNNGRSCRDRSGEILFIDARKLGYMKDRVLRDFKVEDIGKVADTFHAWKSATPSSRTDASTSPSSRTEQSERPGSIYEDIPGFCKSASLEEIAKHEFVLTPGRYVGAAPEEDDGEPFGDKMARLTGLLREQFEEGERLEGEIRENLGGMGFDV